jgi:hypothetical protein
MIVTRHEAELPTATEQAVAPDGSIAGFFKQVCYIVA